MTRDNEVDLLQSKVDLLSGRLKRESQVVCQISGRVVEIRAAVQTEVNVGDAILLIEPTGTEAGTLEAIMTQLDLDALRKAFSTARICFAVDIKMALYPVPG